MERRDDERKLRGGREVRGGDWREGSGERGRGVGAGLGDG